MQKKDGRLLNRKALEQIRITAVKRVLSGEAPKVVMADTDLHLSNIYSWLDTYKKEGFSGLLSHTASGRPPLLGPYHEELILENVINKSSTIRGDKNRLWTRKILLDFLTEKTGTKIGVTALTHFLKSFSIHYDRPLATLRKKTASEDFPELEKAFQAKIKQARKADAILYFCSFSSIKFGPENIIGLSATTPKGQRKFSLYNKKLSSSLFMDWLENLVQDENRNLILVTDDPNIQTFIKNMLPEQISKKIISLTSLTDGSSRSQKDVVHDKSNKLITASEIPNIRKNIKKYGQNGSDKLTELLSLMSRSVLDPLPWYSFLKKLNTTFNCLSYVSVNIHLWNSIICPDIKEISFERHIHIAQHSWPYHPLKKYLKHPGDMAVLDDCLSVKQLQKNPYYNNILWGVFKNNHEISLFISENDGAPCVISLTRSKEQGAFGKAEKKLLCDLLPHLQVTMETYVRLRQCELSLKALHDTTSHIEVATFVLNGSGNVINQNEHALNLIAEKKTLWLRKNRIKFSKQSDTDLFYDYVLKAIEWRMNPTTIKPIGALRVEGKNNHYLGVLIQPIEINSLGELAYITPINPHVIIHISNPTKSQSDLSLQRVSLLFSLSIREAHLAALLSSGNSLEKTAELMNITQNTARTYLQRIYGKLGVNNRSDLVQLISKSVAVF